MGSPRRVEFVSDLDQNEDSLRTFLSGWRQAFAMRSPVSGRVALFCALDRNEGFFRSSIFRCLAMGSPCGLCVFFKNTVNLFIHIARIPIGDSPRVHPNILKCLRHSPVAKGYRLVVIASRAMVCKTPTYYLILYPLAYARGCVILRSHILILLLLILLIFHHIHS